MRTSQVKEPLANKSSEKVPKLRKMSNGDHIAEDTICLFNFLKQIVIEEK